ncbi:FIVAR domain-containing protein [Bifidobacterium tsurumiense]|uniref:FIVAR domain-containing protein n=1 Tax=Bifidobacterium tsurumiense TaxID=356829 RepID=UPI00047A738E|nr:FIVAR domain-containing protein [Bifidobacterium tsurumiense]
MGRNENGKRVWVFDPANNTDRDAGNHRGRPIQAPGWAVNAVSGWADRTDVPAGPEGSGSRRPRRVRMWMVVVAVVCVLAVVSAGLAVWQAVRVRGAMESCGASRSGVLELADGLASAVDGGDVREALSVTADQVEDPDAVTALAAAADDARLEVGVPACEVSWFDLHPDRASDGIEAAMDMVRARSSALDAAVSAVLRSRDAKILADAKTSLQTKTDQADALLADSDGRVQDNAVRDALRKAIDQANTLLGGDEVTVDDLRAAGQAIDQATTAVNDSIKAKQDADAAAEAQAAQQSYTPSYSGGGSYVPQQSYTPSYSGSSGGSSGGSSVNSSSGGDLELGVGQKPIGSCVPGQYCPIG